MWKLEYQARHNPNLDVVSDTPFSQLPTKNTKKWSHPISHQKLLSNFYFFADFRQLCAIFTSNLGKFMTLHLYNDIPHSTKCTIHVNVVIQRLDKDLKNEAWEHRRNVWNSVLIDLFVRVSDKTGHRFKADTLYLTRLALGYDFHQTAGRFEIELRFGFAHCYHSSFLNYKYKIQEIIWSMAVLE